MKTELATTDNDAVKMFTWCDVDAGSYLSTAATAIAVGAATGCPTTRAAGGDGTGKTATTSVKLSITGAKALTGIDAATTCTTQSNCAAGEYLSTSAAANPVASCTACPTGMWSAAGSELASLGGGMKTELATTDNDAVKMFTWCNVDAGSYLSTAATATAVGAVTACSTTLYPSTTSPPTEITAATAAQTERTLCSSDKNIVGPTGAAGPAGAAGATGPAGAAGATGPAGAAPAGANVSPAAPLSTITAAVFVVL